MGAARVVAHNRQAAPGQQALYGRQADPFAFQAVRRRVIAGDASGGVQQVDLHAWVDYHQLAEQIAPARTSDQPVKSASVRVELGGLPIIYIKTTNPSHKTLT